MLTFSSSSTAIADTTIDHRILPDKNAFHPFLRHFSVEQIPSSSSSTSISPSAARSQPLVFRILRVQTSKGDEEMEEYRLVVVGSKTDLAPSSTGSGFSEGAALEFIDELVPLSGSPSSSLAKPEDERDWIPTQGPDRVSSGSGDEVVTLESGAASPVDIILVDETHSASVVHHNDVGSDRENSIPTYAILPRTPSINFHSHHHKHSPKVRSRTSQFSLLPNSTVSSTHTGFTSFQSFHKPASSISDGYEPYHSTQSSPLSHSRSPSSSPSLHRSYHSLSASTMSTSTAATSTAPTITPARDANDLRMFSQTKPSRPLRGPKAFFTSAKRARGAGVSEVFAYVSRHVMLRWDWEEAHAAESRE
jgi:hypothetical protein